MTQNIKEKVLKEVLGDIEKKADEHQLKDCGDPTECHVNLWCYDLSPNIEKAIDLTFVMRNEEVGKVFKDYRKDMKVLEGNTELTFEEHMDNIKQKLGIK